MRYVISQPQFNHFKREGHIELEGFYPDTEAKNLKTLLDEEHAKRSQNTLDAGYELQRTNSAILKTLQCSKLGQLASAFFQKKRLRIAFTQYHPYYPQPATITEISSFTETCGSALIQLGPATDLPYLPSAFGNITFYKNDFPIDYPKLDAPFLLIVFATDTAQYIKNETDPHKNALKKLGYGFGDRITVETHPLITHS